MRRRGVILMRTAVVVLLGLSLLAGALRPGRVPAVGAAGTGGPPAGLRLVGRGATVPAGLGAALRRMLGRRALESRPGVPVLGPAWTQQAEITATNVRVSHFFGVSVALSGDTALVGADGNHNNTGAAYVFVRSGNTWTQQATLTASDGAPKDYFGAAVALSGTTALVGAPNHNNATGAAYVFVRSGSTWTQQAKLTDPAPAAFLDGFGAAVALSTGTALVGAYGKHGNTGAAYVYVQSGTIWRRQATLAASDGAGESFFGAAVALSGSSALVGSYYKTVNGQSAAGAAYVFVRSGTAWSQQAELTAPNAPAESEFGTAVAVSGDTALVGAPFKKSLRGAAYVFVRSGTTWNRQAMFADPAPAAFADDFGAAVALSENTALVAADGKNTFTGAAYVFVRSGATWTQQATLSASDGAAVDQFGYFMALDGTTALVGAPGKNNYVGAAYVFVRM